MSGQRAAGATLTGGGTGKKCGRKTERMEEEEEHKRELMPAPRWLGKQRRRRSCDCRMRVRQMLALSAEASTVSLSALSAEGFPVLE